jgi:hypothetical protein
VWDKHSNCVFFRHSVYHIIPLLSRKDWKFGDLLSDTFCIYLLTFLLLSFSHPPRLPRNARMYLAMLPVTSHWIALNYSELLFHVAMAWQQWSHGVAQHLHRTGTDKVRSRVQGGWRGGCAVRLASGRKMGTSSIHHIGRKLARKTRKVAVTHSTQNGTAWFVKSGH